jgi:Gas vesicle synthesis protein GvpO
MATEDTTESSSTGEATTGGAAESGSGAGTTKKTAKKSTRKSSAKKTTTKKSPAKKSTATKSTQPRERSSGEDRSGDGAPRAEAPKKKSASHIAQSAARQLLELTGREAEGVTSLERTEDGWTVRVEVVELRRIPDTTDILALYDVEVDEDGDMIGYHRVRRYSRGVPGEE